jgi:ethanolamine utilization microcompartment shell protein EutS
MNRPRRTFQASCESLEGKALLSAIPTFTANAYNQVLKQIDRAAGTFAKTHNVVAFENALSQISYKVPYGHEQLLPYWQDDVSIYDPGVRGSGLQMVRQLKTDLKDYVVTAAADGAINAPWLRPSVMIVSPSNNGGVGAVPVLTTKTYNGVMKQIDRAAGTFAKTKNVLAFENALSQISYKVPYGHEQLFPVWQADIGIWDPGIRGSGVEMVRQLKADLKDYVTVAATDGFIRIR